MVDEESFEDLYEEGDKVSEETAKPVEKKEPVVCTVNLDAVYTDPVAKENT